MVQPLLIGCGFAFAAAIQPGPLQAFLFASVARKGWRRTLPACLAPLLSDGPIAVLSLLVLIRLPETWTDVLRVAGGGYLLLLSWGTFRRSQNVSSPASDLDVSPSKTVLQAALVNILNPHPYLGWSLVLGPAILTAWQQSAADGLTLLLAFYGTMTAMLAGTILVFGTTSFLSARAQRILILVSSVTLAAIGVFQLILGLNNLISA